MPATRRPDGRELFDAGIGCKRVSTVETGVTARRDRWRALVRAFREPVAPDTRARLASAWSRVPARFRDGRQFLGRQYAGCGATIGAEPRCDFACRSCYLGPEANRIPRAPLPEVKRQLVRIRAWLGEGGNVQLTDGEVTLLPERDLVELVRHAIALGLVPMVMTHGDSFRRRPGLLERLMVEAGLREVSLHVDTTQRGRLGERHRHAAREEDLDPLRDELADLVREARRNTGRPLDVATTVTVTRENLDGVAAVVRWACRNADAFKMVSFQPVAQVGRTEGGLGGAVSADELWERIAEGAFGDRTGVADLLGHRGVFGHPDCNRFVQGAVVERNGEAPVFRPLLHLDDARDTALLEAWYDRFGGITTRLDTPLVALARVAGVVRRAPRLVLGQVVPFLVRSARRLDPERPVRFALDWMRGRVRVRYLNLVSHHFMSASELTTPLGRERLDLCVFKVPVGGRLVSMCEVNGGGVRSRYYARLRAATPRDEEVVPA